MHRPVCPGSLAELPHHSLLGSVPIGIGYSVSVNETLLGMALMGNLFIVRQTSIF